MAIMMNNEFKFGTMSISELAAMVVEKLKEDGVNEKSELFIYLNKDEFKKVDEDLFYRNKKNDDEEFIPSEGEIDVNFQDIKIIIREKN